MSKQVCSHHLHPCGTFGIASSSYTHTGRRWTHSQREVQGFDHPQLWSRQHPRSGCRCPHSRPALAHRQSQSHTAGWWRPSGERTGRRAAQHPGRSARGGRTPRHQASPAPPPSDWCDAPCIRGGRGGRGGRVERAGPPSGAAQGAGRSSWRGSGGGGRAKRLPFCLLPGGTKGAACPAGGWG